MCVHARACHVLGALTHTQAAMVHAILLITCQAQKHNPMQQPLHKHHGPRTWLGG